MSAREEYQRRRVQRSDIAAHLEFLHQAVLDRGSFRRGYVTAAEFGVRSGNSTAAFLAALEDVRGCLWSLDPDKPDVPAEWYARRDWKFWQYPSESALAQAAVPRWLDVLFIDSHADDWAPARVEEQVRDELEIYWPRVVPGGIVLVHDTEWLPPSLQLPGPYGPVAVALDKFCAEHGMTWENRPGSYGLGVIRR